MQLEPIHHHHIPELMEPMMQIQRTLRQDIAEIGKLLNQSELNDTLTINIRQWHRGLVEALDVKNVDLNPIAEKYLDLLQQLLTMPLINIPYDEKTVLGSDGYAYGYKFLCLHYSKSEPPYSERSPFKQDDLTPFKASSHDIVRFLVPWIKRYRPYFFSEWIEKEFSELTKMPTIPGLSEPGVKVEKRDRVQERIKRIQEQQLRRKKKAEEQRLAADQQFEVLDQVIDQVVVENLAPLNLQIAENHAAQNARLDQKEAEFQEAVNALMQNYDELDERGNIINNEIALLQNELAYIDKEVEKGKADNIRLQIAIKETERAINDRDKGWFKDLIKVVALIGISYFAGVAIQGMLSAAGSTSIGASTTFTSYSARLNLFTKF